MMRSAVVLLLLSAWLLFLLIEAPASVLTRVLPAAVSFTSVRGSLWQGEITGLRWQKTALSTVQWQLMRDDFMPVIRLRFAGSQGLQGEGNIAGFLTPTLFRWQVQASAEALSELFPALALAAPQGGFTLRLARLSLTKAGCAELDGTLRWQDAAVVLGGERIALGDAVARLSCRGDSGFADWQQSSPMLSAQGSVSLNRLGQASLQGSWRPEADFPPSMAALSGGKTVGQQTLSWQGKIH